MGRDKGELGGVSSFENCTIQRLKEAGSREELKWMQLVDHIRNKNKLIEFKLLK